MSQQKQGTLKGIMGSLRNPNTRKIPWVTDFGRKRSKLDILRYSLQSLAKIEKMEGKIAYTR